MARRSGRRRPTSLRNAVLLGLVVLVGCLGAAALAATGGLVDVIEGAERVARGAFW